MVDINQVRFTDIYREHRQTAMAGMNRVRDRIRRRTLIVLPISVAAGVVIAYNAVYAQSAWAMGVVDSLHSWYFMPLLFIFGLAVVIFQLAKILTGTLRLQSQISGLLVATNLSAIDELAASGTAPRERS